MTWVTMISWKAMSETKPEPFRTCYVLADHGGGAASMVVGVLQWDGFQWVDPADRKRLDVRQDVTHWCDVFDIQTKEESDAED